MLSSLLALTLAAAPPAEQTALFTPPAPKVMRLGVAVDVGVPEGTGASLAFAPVSFVRLQFGPAFNGAAPGVRAAATLAPFRTFVRPTLSAHAGHFEPGDARKLASTFSDHPMTRSPLLDQLQYDYLSAHLGLEIGAPRKVSFFIRGGVSRTHVRFGGFGGFLRQELQDLSTTAEPATLSITAPSLQLGLLIPIL